MVLLDFSLTNSILNNVFVVSDNFKLIDIVYVKNYGAAFSMFQNSTVLLIIISIIAMLSIIYTIFNNINKFSTIVFFYSAMLLAGIYCNTYERITLGYVQDFFNLKFINFPVFNISDILINFSVLAIMFLVVTKKYLKND
ncbi:MAG: signal peptidase II [Candidatus Gastranaerophilales bacterium]|nr:signal peptidase II [Candidatus Gastranaerophilales bacterium]